MASHKTNLDLESARIYAQAIERRLKKDRIRVEICGSIRREKATVHDVDLVVGCSVSDFKSIMSSACDRANIYYEELTKTPVPKKFDCLIGEVQINSYFATSENWGAMVLFLTGNQLFNIIMRGEAKKQGYKLSQYGLFHGPEVIAGRTEGQIFDALGLDYIEPKDREVDNKFKLRRSN
jgi:DNA polymerase (family 10)